MIAKNPAIKRDLASTPVGLFNPGRAIARATNLDVLCLRPGR